MKERKNFRSVIALLMAVIFIFVDIPISGVINVNAEDKSELIKTIECSDDLGDFETIVDNINTLYINTQNDSINVMIELKDSVNNLYINDTECNIETGIVDNVKTCQYSFLSDTEYKIRAQTADYYETVTVKWIKDNVNPIINDIVDDDNNSYLTDKNDSCVISQDKKIKVFLTEENIANVYVNDQEILEISTDEQNQKYFTYTVNTSGTYSFNVEDLAGNSCRENVTFKIDNTPPTITSVVSSDDLYMYYQDNNDENNINYIKNDQQNIKVYLSDDLSGVASLNINDKLTINEFQTDELGQKYYEMTAIAGETYNFKVIDNVNNYNEYSYSFTKMIAPTIINSYGMDSEKNYVNISSEINYTEDGKYRIYFNTLDGNSAHVEGIIYSTNDEYDFNTDNISNSMSEDGKYFYIDLNNIESNVTYNFWAYDSNGNVSDKKTVTFASDSAKIEISSYEVKFMPNLSNIFSWNKYKLTLTLTAGQSGFTVCSVKDSNNNVLEYQCSNGVITVENLSKNQLKNGIKVYAKKNVLGSKEEECTLIYSQIIFVSNTSDIVIGNNNKNQEIKFSLESNKTIRSVEYEVYNEDGTISTGIKDTLYPNGTGSYTIPIEELIRSNEISDGNYTVLISVNTNNSNDIQTVNITVDTTKPEFDMSYSDDKNWVTNNSANDVIITNISDNLTGIDIDNCYFLLTNSEGKSEKVSNSENAKYFTYNVELDTITLKLSEYLKKAGLEDGKYTISFYLEDKAENIENKNVELYLSNAETNFETSVTDKWVNINNTECKLIISDVYTGVSGLSSLSVLINGIDYSKYINENDGVYFVDLSNLFVSENLPDGEYSIVTEVRNGAYESDEKNSVNNKIINDIFRVDTINPSITGMSTSYTGKWVSEDIDATTVSTDECVSDINAKTSGINKIYMYSRIKNDNEIDTEYILNNGVEYNGVISAPDVTGASDLELEKMSGYYECFFVAIDNAGNKSDIYTYDNVNFDVSKPKISVSKETEPDYISELAWHKNQVVINYEITTLYARIDTNSIKVQNVSGSQVTSDTGLLTENGNKLSGSMQVNTNGSWRFQVSVKNTAGIENSIEDILFGVDTSKPYFNTTENVMNIDANSCVDNTYYDSTKIVISGGVSDKTDCDYSGIKMTELLDQDGKVVSTCKNLNSYSFTLEDKRLYSGYTLRVTDNVGNYTVSEVLPDMVISQDKSEAIFTPQESYIKIGNKLWYKDNAKINVTVNNNTSGISYVKILINNVTMVEQNNVSENGKITSKDYAVKTTNSIINNDDCSYKITAITKDNAGNSSSDSYIVYKDIQAPQITNFIFNGMDSGNIITTAYGYFFKADTKITVTASDANIESGINAISFYMVSKDGGKSNVITSQTQNGKAVFNVPAGFKGQVYAYATDNAGNKSDDIRLAGVIIETQDAHNKDASITFSKPETSYKDINNLDLYNSNVSVAINIKDSFSGIASASWEVISSDSNASNVNGSIKINNNGVISGDTNNLAGKVNDENIVTSLTKTILVDANSNNIAIKVTFVDNSGYTSTKMLQFSIDKSTPEVTVSYDNNSSDSVNKEMFNNNRVAVIAVKERNFDASDVIVNITNTNGTVPSISGWTKTSGSGNGDNTIYTANIEYSVDGDYLFNVSYMDKCKKVATINYGSSVSPNSFTIDKTKPIVNISFDNNSSSNGNYYQNSRIATISINERNFSTDRVNLSVTQNGSNSTKTISGWNTSGDVHTANIVFDSEAEYSLNLSYSDMAGNNADKTISENFVIDSKEPSLTVEGISDKTAYNKDTVAFTVKSNDTYFNSLETTLYKITSTGEKKEVLLEEKNVENGKVFTISNIESDGIYKLYCVAIDKSNKKTEQNLVFSVNRNGSTYLLGNYADEINKTVVKSVKDNVSISEINVNKIDLNKLSVILYYGSNTIKLKQGTDYTVSESGGNNEWSTYVYTFNKDVFKKEGEYTISITSDDEAGNITSNEDEEKVAGLTFSVDETSPICSIYNLEKGKTYKESNKEVSFNVIDNISLASVTVYLNGKELYTLTGDNLTEDNMKFTINESTKSQTVKIVYVDTAGNSGTTEVNDFYVTTNMVVAYINNGAIIVVAIIIGCLLCFSVIIVVLKKRKRN